MNYFVQGIGAVTPLGPTAEITWQALCDGQQAVRSPLTASLGGRQYFSCSVPSKFVNLSAPLPRLRRSSVLSLMGVTAAQEALAQKQRATGSPPAIIYAICSGAVSYTRRFFDEVLRPDVPTPSPLLFSETVFNGPASHLASVLQMDGPVYTLVGDSAVGLSAIHFATELLYLDQTLENCLVVGTEEMNWVLPEAFQSWRMVSRTPRCEVFGKRRGAVFGEAAAAVLIGREPGWRLAYTGAGQAFFSMKDAIETTEKVVSECISNAGEPDIVLASANGTFIDHAEHRALSLGAIRAPVYAYKPALGDALGAGAVLQVVLGCLALQSQKLPGTLSAGDLSALVNRTTKPVHADRCLISTVGFSQQANALMIEVP